MRRNSALVVETTPDDLPYDLELTQRISLYTITTEADTKSVIPSKPMPPPPLLQEQPLLKPSLRLLFSCLSRRYLLFLLLPAILFSIIAGGVAPFMTYVIGQAFDAFSQFPLTPNPPRQGSFTELVLPRSSFSH